MYKQCLHLALKNCNYVGFLVPASYLKSGLFRDRLTKLIFVNKLLFKETESPVCLALFEKIKTKHVYLYNDNVRIGELTDLEKRYHNFEYNPYFKIKFNSEKGNLGLICIDNTIGASIRFCRVEEIGRNIKHTDRTITKIEIPEVENMDAFIESLNYELNIIRMNTHDVFFSPFKGLRRDGFYRRRIDYFFARKIISKVLVNFSNPK